MQIVQNLCFTQTHKFQTFTECYANLNGSTTNSSTLVHQRVFIFNFELYIFLIKFSIIYVISNEIQLRIIRNTVLRHSNAQVAYLLQFFIFLLNRFWFQCSPDFPWLSLNLSLNFTRNSCTHHREKTAGNRANPNTHSHAPTSRKFTPHVHTWKGLGI